MTDPHHLDELASAWLDGTTTAAEEADLAADPALRAQVDARTEELRAVRDAVAVAPPVDPVRRDAAIAAALEAFDDDRAAAPGAEVIPLAPRRGLSPRAVRVLSAAAVIVVLALLVPLLAGLGTSSDDEAATFEETGAAIGDDATDGAAQESVDPAAPTSLSAGEEGRPTLGTFDDLDELAAALRTGRPPLDQDSAGPNRMTSFDGMPCVADLPPSTVVGLAVVADELVEIYLATDEDGTTTLTVRASGSCEVLDRRQL